MHKLIALGAVVLAVLSFLGLLKGAHLQAVILTSLIVAGLAVIALFATGALLSQGKPVQKLLLLVHAYAPIAAAAGAGLAVYLLAGRR